MFEFAEVDGSNLIVEPVPRYLPTVPREKDNPKNGSGYPKFRPVVFQQPDYDPRTQKLGAFVYRVDGPVVVKTPKVIDLTAEEITTEKFNTSMAHFRQSVPHLEPIIVALARVAQEFLRISVQFDGPGMQAEISAKDLEDIQAFVNATAHIEF